MKTLVKEMVIHQTMDGRSFLNEDEAREHEVKLLDSFALSFTMTDVVSYMREQDDTAGLSYLTRICARMSGFEAPF